MQTPCFAEIYMPLNDLTAFRLSRRDCVIFHRAETNHNVGAGSSRYY